MVSCKKREYLADCTAVQGEVPGLFLADDMEKELRSLALVLRGIVLAGDRFTKHKETNYIRATISLYLDFINLFIALLNLMGIGNND